MSSDEWNKIISSICTVSPSIGALLRSSKLIEKTNECLKLGVYYKFHKDKLEEVKNKKMLEDTLAKIFERQVRFECLITDPPKESELTETNSQNIMLAAEEIFS